MTRQIRATSTRNSRRLRACGVVLGLVLTASCSKASLMAPSSSTLTLLVSRTTVGLSTSVNVTALVYESSGTPVHDGTVVDFFATLGTLSPAQTTTKNGQATVQLLTGTESGISEITAKSGGATLASTVKVTVGAAAAGVVELAASPISLPSTGGTSVLTATVSDASGNRLSGIPVTFSHNAGSLDQSSASTDSNGQAQSRLTTLVNSTVTALVAGGTSGSLTSFPVIITLRTPPIATFGTVTASGFTATLQYSAFPGADGTAITSVTIAFGDGASQGSLGAGSAQSIVHVYGSVGTYVARLTVVDAAGETTIASTAVVVR
ncbi:MAG: Ig-like domain-containing protein [Acidobacteria bacterium]|nr:Ig-like domain-containing protein [Acidobacteriota bacterium]